MYGSPQIGYYNTWAEAEAAANRVLQQQQSGGGTPQVAGASTTNIPDTRDSSFSDNYSSSVGGNPTSNSNIAPTRRPGESDGDYRARINNTDFNLAGGGNYGGGKIQTLDRVGAKGIANSYGFTGMNLEGQFEGLTYDQARQKADKLRKQLLGQVSQNTSFAFNPETISGAGKKVSDLKLKLDENNNDPWTNQSEKKMKNQAIINSYADELAGLFTTPEQVYAGANNPELKKVFDQYQSLGGNLSDVASKLQKTVSVTGETQNPDGTWNVTYSDGTQDVRRYRLNSDGSYSSQEAQTLDEYLGNISSPSDKRALESLIPEKNVYQEQIMLQQSIPSQYRDLYFGTEEQVGIITQRRKQAEEEVKLLDKKVEIEKHNARAKADFEIAKNDRQLQIEADQIEENRLAAKNYMTGMLAKLGALKTTGAAPEALANIEQKYQKQAQNLRTSYDLANRQIGINMNESISNIDVARDEKILSLKNDLSKSEEDILKEVFKLQNEADKNTLSIIQTYTQEYRNQREKYAKEAKAEAEKYLKELKDQMSEYDIDTVGALMEGDYIPSKKGVLMPDGKYRKINLTAAEQQDIRDARVAGVDGIQYYRSLPTAFKNYWQQITSSDTSDRRYATDQIRTEYAKWVKMEEEKKKKKANDLL